MFVLIFLNNTLIFCTFLGGKIVFYSSKRLRLFQYFWSEIFVVSPNIFLNVISYILSWITLFIHDDRSCSIVYISKLFNYQRFFLISLLILVYRTNERSDCLNQGWKVYEQLLSIPSNFKYFLEPKIIEIENMERLRFPILCVTNIISWVGDFFPSQCSLLMKVASEIDLLIVNTIFLSIIRCLMFAANNFHVCIIFSNTIYRSSLLRIIYTLMVWIKVLSLTHNYIRAKRKYELPATIFATKFTIFPLMCNFALE